MTTMTQSPLDRKARGALAEAAAARFLESEGYLIRERNYVVNHIGEIDLIAERGPVIAFVEVKARRDTDIALPRQQVNPKKQRTIARAALGYVSMNNLRNRDFRFDIIELYLDHHGEPAKLEHLVHAFEAPKGLFV